MRYHLSGAQSVAAVYIGLFLAALLHPEGLVESLADRVPAARGLIAPAKAWGETVGIASLKQTLGGAMGREVQAHVAEAVVAAVVEVSPAPVESVRSMRRLITAEEPLRLWVVGDSLLNLAGRELKKALEVSGKVVVDVNYRSSTGLVRLDYHHWPDSLARRLSREEAPDAVLVMMGANDSQHMVVDKQKIERWSEPWVAEYDRRVGMMVGAMTASGSEVYWAGLPVMKHRRHRETAAVVNTILIARSAEESAMTYLPTDLMFSGGDGDYSRFLTDNDGRRFGARDTDGVHFTMSGALWLVDALSSHIDREWGVFGPRRQDNGALSVPAADVSIHRRPDATAYVPDVGDPGVRFPAIYLLPGGWGDSWPGRADASLKRFAAEHGVVIIAAREDADIADWMSGEAGLPVIAQARAVAGLSTSSSEAAGLAMNHPDRFASASRMSGVIDTLSPPWILRPRLPDLTPPRLRVWRSTGLDWVEEAAGEAERTDWEARLHQHVALHTEALYRQGLFVSPP